MVRIIYQKVLSDGRSYVELGATSKDTLPIGGFCTGSFVFIVDKGTFKNYDEGAEAWFDKDDETPPTITVSFDMQDHGTQIDDDSVTWGTTTSAPTPPTETGYTFGGWYDEPECTNAHDWTAEVVNRTIVYAKWTATEYTITYDLDGGTNSDNNPAKFTIESDDIVFEPATKEDYTFDGWYGNDSFTGDPVLGVESGSHADVTVYAKFTADEEEAAEE